jgi:NADPH:quinone reductase-like Zn-dependent oxidoreductase
LVRRFLLSSYPDTVPEAERRASTAQLFDAASRGEIKAVVQEVLPMKEAVQARRAMEAGGVVGGLVLIP